MIEEENRERLEIIRKHRNTDKTMLEIIKELEKAEFII